MMRTLLTLWVSAVPALPLTALEHRVTLPITRYEYAVTANLDRAVQALQNTVIAPGGEFSLNTALGPRSAATGYKQAPVIGGSGVMIREFGGGLCMISSIVYNLSLVSGLEIIERHPHQRVVRYTAPGLDATIDYKRKDLRIRNNLSFPVRITLTRHGKYLSAELTGDKKAGSEIRIEREVATDVIPGALEQGFRVRTMRVYYSAGYPSRKEILSEDTFLPIDHAHEEGPL